MTSTSPKLLLPRPIYEGAKSTQIIHDNSIHLLGFCFDGTACFRKGTHAGPNAIREVSEGIESYSPYLDIDIIDGNHFYDLGNLPTDRGNTVDEVYLYANQIFEETFQNTNLKESNTKIITMGGEHSISYAPMKKYLEDYEDLTVLHLDAHADLRDGYLGHHYSHASIIYRIQELMSQDQSLIQYGIRSGTKEEYEWMEKHKTLKKSRNEFLESVASIPSDRPIYLTLDLDYFDPGIFPGTGTPEPGGEDFHSFISLMKILKDKNFVGADIVELSPPIDASGNSDVFATKVVREVIATMKFGERR